MGKKYYHICTECHRQTYYETGSDNNKLRVTTPSMSPREKRKIYYERFKSKRQTATSTLQSD